MESSFVHVTVLQEEAIAYLNVTPEGRYLDATVGGGGHTAALVEAGAKHIVALDRDRAALAAAQQRLEPYRDRATIEFVHTNFADYQPPELLDGIIADLGVSSPQLDRPERGFSFRHDAPLDMRMNPDSDLPTAADWVNHRDEEELVKIFSEFGEERFSKRIARQIVARRPFSSTTQLANAIRDSVPGKARYGRIHPATRVFQALRIAVNGELDALDRLLHAAPTWLHPDGRLVIISFHSLEDRRVKWGFRNDERLKILTKKPVQANESETRSNPRARSAKLRAAQRLPISPESRLRS
ncbi:MAG: 16S rRNA (cytosine(1402)-N(4))-methyltransferase RsmH [Cyanobacteria bacterium P01_E01_bin.45]